MKRLLCLTLFGLALALTVTNPSVRAQGKPAVDAAKIDCLDCHTCPVPTAKDMCLRQCPSLTMTHVKTDHQLREAPDSMLLSELSQTYQPVHFNHKLHAGMAEMKDSCSTCHHYSPKGKIAPCKECHTAEGDPNNLRQPGLKGAYHRQCLSCHREWSHDTKCVVCHLPTEVQGSQAVRPDPTDIVGASHPVITVPVKKVYDTPYKLGPIVTFQHKEHIDLFGFRCVDCHRQENCGYCHDIQRPANVAKTQEQVHAVCKDCHAKDLCAKCHDVKERPGFSHNKTGWPLNPYHNTLDCWACHPTGKRISRVSKMCENCHAGWNQDNFKHAVTGLKLDEVHGQLDCTACHPGRKFESDAICSDCHDDGRTATKTPPGVRMNKRSK
jgi:hypothetical protein